MNKKGNKMKVTNRSFKLLSPKRGDKKVAKLTVLHYPSSHSTHPYSERILKGQILLGGSKL